MPKTNDNDLLRNFMDSEEGIDEATNLLLQSGAAEELLTMERYRDDMHRLTRRWYQTKHASQITHEHEPRFKRVEENRQRMQRAVLTRIVRELESCQGNAERMKEVLEIAHSLAYQIDVASIGLHHEFVKKILPDLVFQGFMPPEKRVGFVPKAGNAVMGLIQTFRERFKF